MDKIQEASNVIVNINKYRNGNIKDYELITSICGYFDKIKNEDLTQSDLRFLKYISNAAGIPHYYDLLASFKNKDISIKEFDLKTMSSVLYESTLHTDINIKLHKYQKEVLTKFRPGQLNRFVLSASTSFGKTFLVYEIIKKMNYRNIVLIFPTIALLSENLELLMTDYKFKYFDQFTKHTLSSVEELSEKNIFIFTPERFLSYIEKNENDFDFVFVDEMYKIDNDYLIDDSARENERDVAYRIALHNILINDIDVLLAGPYIGFPNKDEESYNPSFDNFARHHKFNLINYNDYEIVNKSINEIKAKTLNLDDDIIIKFDSTSKVAQLIETVASINKNNENSIIYCSRKKSVETYADKLISSEKFDKIITIVQTPLIKHLKENFRSKWILVRALEYGIGIHHGLVPKYIQKEIISLFNKGELHTLLSTTTITEGVNTSAKNMIVLHAKKGKKTLKKFDAKNISGRAGRFLHHYSGRVIVLDKTFKKIIESDDEAIKHKNYDKNSPKDEIDLFFTEKEYLNDTDRKKRNGVKEKQAERNIPDEIMNLYKVISRADKIEIFDNISKMSLPEKKRIKVLISRINYSPISIDFDGFQIILHAILPIIKNEKLKFLINHKPGASSNYSTLTFLVNYYLKDGFMGSLNYKINEQNHKVDDAVRETSEFIYNILKYHLVKYLGVFNTMYKFEQSKIMNTNYDQINGIEKLLIKLEYNAVSTEGRIVSDYGVPYRIVEYYDNPDRRRMIKFDEYENQIFAKVKKLID